MAYLDAAMHGHNAAAANAKLEDLIKILQKGKTNVAAMPPYKSYAGFRDSVINYLNMGYKAATSFSGIFGPEEMMAMPFEKAKAIMEASDVLNDKLNIYSALIKREQKRFAEKNGFSIEVEKNPLDLKLLQVKKVLRYYHTAFLIFFKCNRQEITFLDTLNDGNPKSLETVRSRLQQYTEESLRKFDTFPAFDNDRNLVNASKEALQFFESEAKDKFPVIVEYFQKKEKFDKQAAALDNVPQKDRTNKMIDSYNANLNAVKDAGNQYNSTNQELNAKRAVAIKKYNQAINDFFDKNTPKLN
jgi:hypothetical protein